MITSPAAATSTCPPGQPSTPPAVSSGLPPPEPPPEPERIETAVAASIA